MHTPLLPLPKLPAAIPRSGLSLEARKALRQLLGDIDRQLAGAFWSGHEAAMLAQRRCEAVECVIKHVWQACLGEMDNAALLAVGGFGRGSLFPHSDVDLLVLVGNVDEARYRALEQYFTVLWDLGLKVGHAVRNLAQCQALAAEDACVFTSLLDARFLFGHRTFAQQFATNLDLPGIWPAAAYLAARLADSERRHARFHDSTHNLEPNLKDGPGGLRTLDALRWLGRRLAHAPDFTTMVVLDLLDAAEQAQLESAEAVLQRYRFALHLEARRPEERLLFDYQRSLATKLGFVDEHAANLGVEQFMQAYYRAAAQIERLGVQVIERFEELLETSAAGQPVGRDFERFGNRLASVDPELFMRHPAAMVESFLVRMAAPGVHAFTAETMRRLHQAIAWHGEKLAGDQAALAALLQLLRWGAPAADALWRMNRHGLLTMLIPELGRVFGRMQYDLFHVYTVDEHSLRVVRNVARFANPEARKEFPLAVDIWPTLPAPEVLLLAALLHDLAKGRGGDHAVLGEQIAREFCARLGLPAHDVERVAWLVRWHLLMSVTAQRQDITDPMVVARFAEAVGDSERLGQLYLLTIADITGTSPKLWNGFKDHLLAELYHAARYALRSGYAGPLDVAERVQACQRNAISLLIDEDLGERSVHALWQQFPEMSFLRHRPEQIAWQTQAILRAQGALPLIEVHPLSIRGSSELFVYAPDRDGLFATVTAVLDRLHCSVQEARILGTRDGKVLDTFLLLEVDTQRPMSLERAEELRLRLLRALSQTAPVLPSKRSLSRHLRHFQMTPQLAFHTEGRRSRLALVCTDAPGLLAAVAQAMLEAEVRVHDARIATFGEHVEDFFMLSDRHDAPLSEEQQARLQKALLARLSAPPLGEAKPEFYGPEGRSQGMGNTFD